MNRKDRSSFLRITCLLLWLLFHCLHPNVAQIQSVLPETTEDDKKDTVQAEQEIVAIPIPKVSEKIQETSSILRDVRNMFNEVDFSVDADSLLPALDSTYLLMAEEVFKDSLSNLNLQRLQDVLQEFEQLYAKYQSMEERLDEQKDILEPDLELTNTLLEQWTKTKNQEVDGGIPELVMDRIDAVIEGISRLKNNINDKMNDLLVAENRLAGSMIVLRESIDIVEEQIEARTQHMFSIDSPKLWKLLQRSGDSISVRQEAARVWKNQQSDFRNFVDQYPSQYGFQIVLFFALFLLLSYSKVRIGHWSKEKRAAASELSMKVIRRPLAVALIIALLITPFNYPDAPEAPVRLIYLWSIIPIMYLVPILIPMIERRYIYLFGILFVASEFSSFLERYYIIDRIALLAFDVIAIGIYYFVLRRSSPILKKLREKNMHFALLCLHVIWFFHFAGILSNLFGLMVMSKLLSHGAFVILFAGVMIYVANLVLKSLFNLFMYSDASRFFRVIEKYPDDISRGMHRLINIGGVVFFIYVILDDFLLYRPLIEALVEFFEREWTIGEVSISAGSILAFLLTLWVALEFSRIIRILLQDEILSRFDMKRGVPGAISMVVRIVLITVGFIIAFAAAGIELSNIAIIFGALGVGIGFGLQNIVNNLISGMIIAFERPIQVGDIIQIASLNLMGNVQEIGIRSSIVKTFDGAEVVVPNGNIISNEMINWTLSDRRRRQEILVGVKYGSDLSRVLGILNDVVTDHEQVLKKPEPLIVFTGFGDSSLNFRVLFWTHFDVGLTTKSAVGVAINEAFRKEGIEIPFPQRDLHLKDPGDMLKGPQKTSKKRGSRSTGSKAGPKVSRSKTGQGTEPGESPGNQ